LQPLQADTQTKAAKRVCFAIARPKRTKKQENRKEHRSDNITYTQAGVLCFDGQKSAIFEVQFFIGSSVVKIPACV
jgi:hypothetical protein